IATDKVRTAALAHELGIASPFTVVVRTADELGRALDSVSLPVVVKPARSWAAEDRGGSRVQGVVVTRREEARAVAEGFLGKGVATLLQEWIGGRKESVSLLLADGRIAARFAQVAYRTAPPLGGSFVLRESIALPPDTTEQATALVQAMGLE